MSEQPDKTDRLDFGVTPDSMDSAPYRYTSTDECAVHIEPVDNGFLIRQGPRVEVCEEDEYAQDGEAQATMRLLYQVLDMLGRLGSKHDAYRVRISVVDQREKE